MRSFVYIIFIALVVSGCGTLQREIELELPEYEPEFVVECYLQPGLPYFLLLTNSQPYFDDIQIEYETEATVVITHRNVRDTLQEVTFDLTDPNLALLGADTALLNILGPIVGTSITVYLSLSNVPEHYNENFDLEITTLDGSQLTSTTQIMEPVPIDSLFYQRPQDSEDTSSLVLTLFTDPGGQTNYYRRVLENRERRIDEANMDTTWVSDVEQDFIVDDDLFDGQPFAFGTGFDYDRGDTTIHTLYHLTFDHFRYIETRDAALAASLSPFGQPAVLYSNIKGGLGLFTGVSFDQVVGITP